MRPQDLSTAKTVAKISVVSNTAGGNKSVARRSTGLDYSSWGCVGGVVGAGEVVAADDEVGGPADGCRPVGVITKPQRHRQQHDDPQSHRQRPRDPAWSPRATMAYDAGSERNNQLAAFIPGPCCNHPFVRDPEGQLIRPHEGITGRGDLDPALYDWADPVARFTIQPRP
jgi:hypothetical protein